MFTLFAVLTQDADEMRKGRGMTSLWSFRAFAISIEDDGCMMRLSIQSIPPHQLDNLIIIIVSSFAPPQPPSTMFERDKVNLKNNYVDRCHAKKKAQKALTRLSTLTRIKFYRIFFRVTTSLRSVPRSSTFCLVSLIKISRKKRSDSPQNIAIVCFYASCRSCIAKVAAQRGSWMTLARIARGIAGENIKSDVLVFPSSQLTSSFVVSAAATLLLARIMWNNAFDVLIKKSENFNLFRRESRPFSCSKEEKKSCTFFPCNSTKNNFDSLIIVLLYSEPSCSSAKLEIQQRQLFSSIWKLTRLIKQATSKKKYHGNGSENVFNKLII